MSLLLALVGGGGASVTAGPLVLSGASSLVIAASTRKAIGGPLVLSGASSLVIAASTRKAIGGPLVLSGVGVVFVAEAAAPEPEAPSRHWNIIGAPRELGDRWVGSNQTPLGSYIRTGRRR